MAARADHPYHSKEIDINDVFKDHVLRYNPESDAELISRLWTRDDIGFYKKQWFEWNNKTLTWDSFEGKKNRLVLYACLRPYNAAAVRYVLKKDKEGENAARLHLQLLLTVEYQEKVLAIAGKKYFKWSSSTFLVLPFVDGTVMMNRDGKLVCEYPKPCHRVTEFMDLVSSRWSREKVSIAWSHSFEREQLDIIITAAGQALFEKIPSSTTKRIILYRFPKGVVDGLIAYLQKMVGTDYCVERGSGHYSRNTRIYFTSGMPVQKGEFGRLSFVITHVFPATHAPVFSVITYNSPEKNNTTWLKEMEAYRGFYLLRHAYEKIIQPVAIDDLNE